MLLKEGPVNASASRSRQGAGPVSRSTQGIMGTVVFRGAERTTFAL